MLAKPKDKQQASFFSTFEEQLNHSHPLYLLANRIDWKNFEDTFKKHYSDTMGAPAKPIRMMTGLLMLKHIRSLSDQSVVEQWAENAYYQYFCGEKYFAASEPCVPTELVEFRKRIGEEGVELIFQESIRINGKDGKENEATTDTTVQEKNITFPTDSKLHRKIINKCKRIAERENIEPQANVHPHGKKTYARPAIPSSSEKLRKSKKSRPETQNHSRKIGAGIRTKTTGRNNVSIFRLIAIIQKGSFTKEKRHAKNLFAS